MRKAIGVLAVLVSFAVVGVSVAVAAELQDNFVGAGCPDGAAGTWHFVNTQTGGGSDNLDVIWSTGSESIAPSKVNANNVQYTVVHDGFLQSASNDLAGKIVVSDLTCGEAPPPPPPPPPPPAP